MVKKIKSDYDLLKKHYRFIRSDNAEENSSWEEDLVRKYDKKLQKDVVICDLSHYDKGQLGLRWRTQREVILGKGKEICADKNCTSKQSLGHYEVYFQYIEAAVKKDVLVTVILCDDCSKKLKSYQKSEKKKQSNTEHISSADSRQNRMKHSKNRTKRSNQIESRKNK